MDSIFLIILVGIAGGIAVALQSPLASLLSQRMGILESIFIVHLGGAILSLLPLLLLGGGRLSQWRSAPWYALGAGFFGLIVITAVSIAIPRVGVAVAVTAVVAGQVLMSAILDNFGWLGTAVRPLDASRLLGLAIVMLGVWLTVR